MTRKCALCKGTNYKRTYSFFSAPKNPDIRKKWQAAIPIANYTVTDDTYICSKHFRSSDIITHWVSGVPPHVIKIKYKKCRLRIGAVPCLNFENNHDAPGIVDPDQVDRPVKLRSSKTDSLIPHDKPAESIAVNSRVVESNFNNSNEGIELPIKIVRYNVVDQYNARCSQTENVADNSPHKGYLSNNEHMQDSMDLVVEKQFNQSRNHLDYKYPQIHKVVGNVPIINGELQDDSNSKNDGKFQDARIHYDAYSKATILSHNVKLEQNVQVFNEELIIQDDAPVTLHMEHLTDNHEVSHADASENKHRIKKIQELGDNLLEALQYKVENKCNEENLDSRLCDTMLFEDLLEIYTEVTLPRGWAFLVTSKGQTTTVVYLYMYMPTNNIPVVEKEVYIKSDMVMRCGVGSTEIDPFLHNLMKDGRNNKVHALSDIEELIDEFDQRYICEGGPIIQDYTDIEMQLAYVDGAKWRHIGCPIIINNGSSKCSRCSSLNNVIARKRDKRGLSFDMLKEKQKKITNLRRSLKKITRHNQRLEGIKLRFKHRLRLLLASSDKTIKNRISSSNMPEIQKLMIKECLKASMLKNTNNVHYSETWVFLCLLLYIESPRMYRYILVNKYMTLPSMGTIKKYFHQIKTDPQFYNLFQRSVEPYQPVNEQDAEEPP